MHKLLEQQKWQWVALLLMALIWSGVFILTKKGLAFFPPLEAASIRMLCASISVLPLMLRYFKKLNRENITWLFASAILGNSFPIFIVVYAQTGMSSAMTGVLNALMPCFAFIVGVLFFRIPFRWVNFSGLLIGTAGTTGLVLSAGGNLYASAVWPVGFMVLSVLSHGFNINIIKQKLAQLEPPAIIAGIFLFVGPIAASVLIYFRTWEHVGEPGFWKAFGYLAFVGVVATNIALLGFNYLLKYTSAIFAASVTYIIPLFAIVWGVLDGEGFHFQHMLFSAVILGGVYLVNKPGDKTRQIK